MKLASLLVLGAVLAVSAPARAQTSTTTAEAPLPAAPRPEESPATEPAPAAAEATGGGAASAGGSKRSIPPAFSPYRSLSDEELSYEYEHNSLGGPIALTVVGGSVSALALPTFLFSGIGALVCAANDVGDCTAIDTVAAVSGVSTAVFGTMTILGVVWLANRSQTRTALRNEMWRRQAEGQTEGASLTLGLRPVYGGSMLTVGGRF